MDALSTLLYYAFYNLSIKAIFSGFREKKFELLKFLSLFSVKEFLFSDDMAGNVVSPAMLKLTKNYFSPRVHGARLKASRMHRKHDGDP